MKQWLLVLIPTALTGLASLSPVIWDYYTKWSGDLRYETLVGPTHRAGAEYKRIFYVKASNMGRSRVSNVTLFVDAQGGKIEDVVVEDTNRITESKQIHEGTINVTAKGLHAKEEFGVSAILSFAGQPRDAKITLRSDETLGYDASTVPAKPQSAVARWAALYASGMVFLMSLLASTTLAPALFGAERGRKLSKFLIASPIGRTVLGSLIDRREALLFVSELFRIPGAKNTVISAKPELSYREFAAFLSAIGLNSEADVRKRCVAALLCLLHIRNMSPVSIQSVQAACQTLDGGHEVAAKALKIVEGAAAALSPEAFRDVCLDVAQREGIDFRGRQNLRLVGDAVRQI